MQPQTMKTAEITRFGVPEVFEINERPLPDVKLGHVLVRLSYIGMMYGDIIDRANLFDHPGEEDKIFPMITEHEAVGVVVEIAPGANIPPEIQVGSRVAFDDSFEAYAQYVTGPADRFIPIPDDISNKVAAATIHNGIATHIMLTEVSNVTPGDYVLVTAARGGEGSNLVQWLSALGAKVIARTRDPRNTDYIKSLGAWAVIEGTEGIHDGVMRLTGGQGVSTAFDGVGGADFQDVVDSLARRGQVITYGIAGGNHNHINPLQLLAGSRSVRGLIHLEFIEDRPSLLKHADAAWEAVRSGAIKPNVSKVFPLKEMREVHRFWETPTRTGKVLIKV